MYTFKHCLLQNYAFLLLLFAKNMRIEEDMFCRKITSKIILLIFQNVIIL